MSTCLQLQQAIDILFRGTAVDDRPTLEQLTREALRTAFRKIAFCSHPDRAMNLDTLPSALATDFIQAQSAFEVLNAEIQVREAQRSTQKVAASRPSGLGKSYLPKRKLLIAEYLMHTRRISHSHLQRAVQWQEQSRPRVGEIAATQGFISKEQIQKILLERRRLRKSQTPFVQFAVNNGYFDGLAKLAILGRQRKLQKPIGSFFLENKLLKKDELNRALVALKIHNAEFAV